MCYLLKDSYSYWTSTDRLAAFLSVADYPLHSVVRLGRREAVNTVLHRENNRLFFGNKLRVQDHHYLLNRNNVQEVLHGYRMHVTIDSREFTRCHTVSLLAHSDTQNQRNMTVCIYTGGMFDDYFVVQHLLKAIQYFLGLTYNGKVRLDLDFPNENKEVVDDILRRMDLIGISHPSFLYGRQVSSCAVLDI